jgi:hypothetical protein
MTTRSISFVLLDSADGNPYKETESATVSVDSSSSVNDFLRSVKQKYSEDGSNLLDDIHPSQLLVYKNFQDFDHRNIDEEESASFLTNSHSLDGRWSAEDWLAVVVQSSKASLVVVQSSKSTTQKISQSSLITSFIFLLSKS